MDYKILTRMKRFSILTVKTDLKTYTTSVGMRRTRHAVQRNSTMYFFLPNNAVEVVMSYIVLVKQEKRTYLNISLDLESL
jgi:hypothetical protein